MVFSEGFPTRCLFRVYFGEFLKGLLGNCMPLAVEPCEGRKDAEMMIMMMMMRRMMMMCLGLRALGFRV